ncbi:MAG TPA: xanthine dehydrogenase family protein molybdopterin-binding subunit [Acidimicrobiia bacterium]|nr:xanthine dehydrogenase family protein molybdopterin-binding subunit [Acidimicrobiia bacterium]
MAVGDGTATPRFFGQRVRRREDSRFLRGTARFIDDIVLPRMLWASFVRSTEPHAHIGTIDAGAALAVPGVRGVTTGAMLAGRVQPIRCDSTMPTWQGSAQPALATDKVRFVGEAIACVLADERAVAVDAAELVNVEYERLPALTDATGATAPGAPLLHEGWSDNYFIRRHFETEGFDAAIDGAPHRLTRTFTMARHSGIPLEPRGCIAEWDDASDVLVMRTATQVPHLLRTGLADFLGVAEHRIRVVAPDVGGGFGIKGNLNTEELVCARLAMDTGRPVKWIETRREHLLAAAHAREHTHEVDVGFDDDGVVLALRARLTVDVGAYSIYPWTSTMDTGMALGILPGPYRIRHYAVDSHAVATNKTPLGPYRGVARPAACFTIERVMDAVADTVEIDRAEVRRRNLVQAEDFPYTSVTGLVYDSGSMVESLDLALAHAGEAAFRKEQADARDRGRLLGLGMAVYTEQTAHTFTEFAKRGIPQTFGYETATVRMDPSGRLTLFLSVHSHGQGLETTMAQMAADALGVDLDSVRVSFGDTAEVAYGSGTFASRAAVLSGGAVHLAASDVAAKLRRIAAAALEAADDDIVLAGGRAFVRGTPTRGYEIAEIARWTYHNAQRLPPGETPVLEATRTYDAAPGTGTFANAAIVALVEVDAETGFVRLLRLVAVEDCGRVINPTIVEGQVHGGLAQGVGSALFEEFVYDTEGQLRTATLLDYLLPTPTDIPPIEVHHLETPSPFTIHGLKGMGEGGAIGPGAAIAAAVEDAIRPLTTAHVDRLPLTPERVLGWITAR